MALTVMNKNDMLDNLVVKQSAIKGAGRGLFTTSHIPSGTIFEYRGYHIRGYEDYMAAQDTCSDKIIEVTQGDFYIWFDPSTPKNVSLITHQDIVEKGCYFPETQDDRLWIDGNGMGAMINDPFFFMDGRSINDNMIGEATNVSFIPTITISPSDGAVKWIGAHCLINKLVYPGQELLVFYNMTNAIEIIDLTGDDWASHPEIIDLTQ